METLILDTARKMFLADGYATTTMEAIALAAGISKRTLYVRFSDKSALFNAVVSERLETWRRTEPIGLFDPEVAVPEMLFRFGAAFIELNMLPEMVSWARLIAAEAERFPEVGRLRLEGLRRTTERLATAIREHDRTGFPSTTATGLPSASSRR